MCGEFLCSFEFGEFRVQKVTPCPWEFFEVLWREQFLEGSLGALSSLLELSSLESLLAFYKE